VRAYGWALTSTAKKNRDKYVGVSSHDYDRCTSWEAAHVEAARRFAHGSSFPGLFCDGTGIDGSSSPAPRRTFDDDEEDLQLSRDNSRTDPDSYRPSRTTATTTTSSSFSSAKAKTTTDDGFGDFNSAPSAKATSNTNDGFANFEAAAFPGPQSAAPARTSAAAASTHCTVVAELCSVPGPCANARAYMPTHCRLSIAPANDFANFQAAPAPAPAAAAADPFAAFQAAPAPAPAAQPLLNLFGAPTAAAAPAPMAGAVFSNFGMAAPAPTTAGVPRPATAKPASSMPLDPFGDIPPAEALPAPVLGGVLEPNRPGSAPVSAAAAAKIDGWADKSLVDLDNLKKFNPPPKKEEHRPMQPNVKLSSSSMAQPTIPPNAFGARPPMGGMAPIGGMAPMGGAYGAQPGMAGGYGMAPMGGAYGAQPGMAGGYGMAPMGGMQPGMAGGYGMAPMGGVPQARPPAGSGPSWGF